MHFSDEQWADYVRGVAESPSQLESHLDAGCDLCARSFTLLKMVQQTALTDSSSDVPDFLIEQVEQLLQPKQQDLTWTERLLEIQASLVWQQQRDWVPVGVRTAIASTAEGTRTLYQAGNFLLDLNCESGQGDTGEIVGQIIDENGMGGSLEGVLVQVIAGGKAVGETTTNRFGEFIIGVPQSGKPVLRLAIKESGQRIDVPIYGLERQ